MARSRVATLTAQAWIEPVADDPEATTALAVARDRLPGGRALEGLRRLRVFELSGALPDRAAIEALLHRSIQFYNPAKERCTLRLDPRESPPLGAGEVGVLVLERGGERRPAAERWWRHETGTPVEIREGVAWALRVGSGVRALEIASDLAILRDRAHGLLCNPHWQDARVAGGEVPLPWIAPGLTRKGGTAARPRAARKRRASARPRSAGARSARRKGR